METALFNVKIASLLAVSQILTRWNRFLSGVLDFYFLTFFDVVDTQNENCWLSGGLNFTFKLFSGITKFASVLLIQMLLNKMYLSLFSWLCFISYCLISYQKFNWTPCISLNYGKTIKSEISCYFFVAISNYKSVWFLSSFCVLLFSHFTCYLL